mmetsp:Transcript_15553/g.25942  ORF Transcript_15553/g.25942 Transcript_15553/m.25942 type:complete len:125 (-) Transcript_15553:1988-2362(-)
MMTNSSSFMELHSIVWLMLACLLVCLRRGSTNGIGYVISFAIGASFITVLLWIFRYLYLLHKCRSFREAFSLLPSFHVRKMWLQGGTSGLLWSIGNFFSMISVKDLGEGVGYSVIQVSVGIDSM